MWAKSFGLRAVLAIGCLIGFYLVGIAAGLTVMIAPTALMIFAGRIAPKLALISIIAGGGILWALVPRRQPWTEPGPRITERDQPKLFAFIRDIASKMNTEMPEEVYLIPDVNAFVTTRGGVLGFGGRRVMGIGLTLMAVHNVSELRAVIAHEFGHFVGDETRLAGVIYATRAAMIRTVQGSGLGFLFEWIFKLYMRLTMSISRQQELLADSWSVRLAGRAANARSLRLGNVHAVGFKLFMQNEVSPLAAMKCVPDNLFDGYKRYTKSSTWQRIAPDIDEQSAAAPAAPYDSHPSFEERIAWNEKQPDPGLSLDETPSTSLLEDVDAVEQRFSTILLPPEGREVIAWTDIGPVWGKMQRNMAARLAVRAPGFTLARMRAALDDRKAQRELAELVDPMYTGADVSRVEVEIARVLNGYFSAWLGAVLAERGYAWRTIPGEPLSLVKDEAALSPEEIMRRVFDEKKPEAEALEDFAKRAELDESATLTVTDTERAEQSKPFADITVGPDAGRWTVRGDLTRMRFPRCCAVCAGPSERTLQWVFPVKESFGDDRQLQLTMDACVQHTGAIGDAVTVKAFNQNTNTVTLSVKNAEVARLLRACNL